MTSGPALGTPASLRLPWLLLWPLFLWVPASRARCLFDEVQATVRVVAPPLSREAPPSQGHPGTAGGNRTAQATPPGAIDTPRCGQSPPTRAKAWPAQSHLREAPPTSDSAPPRRRSSRSSVLPLQPRAPPPQASPLGHSDAPPALPIRIRTWRPRESPALSALEGQRLEPAVAEAIRTVSGALSVIRVPDRLLLVRDVNKYCKFIWRNSSTANYNRCGKANENYSLETCLDITIPDAHLAGCVVYPDPDSPDRIQLRPEGAGLPDTDFLLYLHTHNTDKCRAESSVLAYAVHCQTDSWGRPVAGVVVICRDRLTAPDFSHRRTVQTVIHELLHTLGFSKELFHTWRDCSHSHSSHMGGECSVRGQVTNTDETGQVRIYTPTVIAALQAHLHSDSPELGAPLENQVPPGSVSSHWEARVLQGSVMTAALGEELAVRLDPVTLSALQDTGWYRVNYSSARSLDWGQGEGASFGLVSSCHDGSSPFFCSGSGSGCHYLHLHKGECQTDQYLDGCRMYKPLASASECWKEENERVGGADAGGGEIFRADSRCFFSSLTRENLPLSHSPVVARCYRHRCTGLNQYQIRVSGSGWVECPAGGTVQVPGYRGLVFCPDKRFCHAAAPSPGDQPPPSLNMTSEWSVPVHAPSGSGPSSGVLPMTSDPTMLRDPSFSVPLSVSSSQTTLAVVLGSLAALSVLALVVCTLVIVYRRHRASRLRVHAVGEAPNSPASPDQQLQPPLVHREHPTDYDLKYL
ncbi:ciliated left-right organizer metallopeptidase [Lepisosteus oculatus]|uniref:ciliated left-right organizer metallopeptidase n=1 Tax=Lepisosteus oculatus TaxID=7918 RepID=UPI00371C7D46